MEMKKIKENVNVENDKVESLEENKIVWNDNEQKKPEENQIIIDSNGEVEKKKEEEIPKANAPKGRGKKKKEEIPENKENQDEKPVDKDWASKIPEDQKIKPGTVFYLVPNDKFGTFVKYGKKEGIYYLAMFKKDSIEKMSKDWSVKSELLELVEKDGKIENDKFVKTDDKGYQLAASLVKKEEATNEDKMPVAQ